MKKRKVFNSVIVFTLALMLSFTTFVPVHASAKSQSISTKFSSCTIYKGTSASIKASAKTKITYKSSNTKVAKVTSTGTIKALKAGKAMITVRAAKSSKYKAASKTITVTVLKKSAPLISTLSISQAGKVRFATKQNKRITSITYRYATSKKGLSSAKAKTVKANVVDVTKTLKKGKTYYFSVRAVVKDSLGRTYKTATATESVYTSPVRKYIRGKWLKEYSKPSASSTSKFYLSYMDKITYMGIQKSYVSGGSKYCWIKYKYSGIRGKTGIYYSRVKRSELNYYLTDKMSQHFANQDYLEDEYCQQNKYVSAVVKRALEIYNMPNVYAQRCTGMRKDKGTDKKLFTHKPKIVSYDHLYQSNEGKGCKNCQKHGIKVGTAIFDCSGFTGYVLNNTLQKQGIMGYRVATSVLRMGKGQSKSADYSKDYPVFNEGFESEFVPEVVYTYEDRSKEIDYEQLKPGDFLFFDYNGEPSSFTDNRDIHHTGIYLGYGEFIHCTWGGVGGVMISKLDRVITPDFAKAIRYIPTDDQIEDVENEERYATLKEGAKVYSYDGFRTVNYENPDYTIYTAKSDITVRVKYVSNYYRHWFGAIDEEEYGDETKYDPGKAASYDGAYIWNCQYLCSV